MGCACAPVGGVWGLVSHGCAYVAEASCTTCQCNTAAAAQEEGQQKWQTQNIKKKRIKRAGGTLRRGKSVLVRSEQP